MVILVINYYLKRFLNTKINFRIFHKTKKYEVKKN